MQHPITCGIFGLLMVALLDMAVTFPVDESALAQRESYLAADEVFGPELKERSEREKRKGGGFLEPIVEASFNAKSRVIGLIFGKINQLIDSKNRWVDQLDRKNIEQNKRVIANQNCNTGTGGASSGSSSASSSGSSATGGSSGSSSGSVYIAPAAAPSLAGQSKPTYTSTAGQSAVNYNPGQSSVNYSPTGGQTVATFGSSFGTSVGQAGPSFEYLPPQNAPSYDSSGPSYQPSTGNDYGYRY